MVDRLGLVNTIRYTTALGVMGVILFILGSDLWTVLVGVLCWAVGVSMGFPSACLLQHRAGRTGRHVSVS